MKTSTQWWNEVKNDEVKLIDWLKRQYRGEVSASRRIRDVIKHFDSNKQITPGDREILLDIAADEAVHAVWVKGLLKHRGIDANRDLENAENRYWATQDLSFKDFAKTMAVGAHAEKMRLERIQVIASDTEAPADIRQFFQLILMDELYHEKAFRRLAGSDAMAATKADHEEGRRLLGLEA